MRSAFVVLLFVFLFLLLYTHGVCGNYFANVLRERVVDKNGPKYIYSSREQGRKWQMLAVLQSGLGPDEPHSVHDDKVSQDGSNQIERTGVDGPVKLNNDTQGGLGGRPTDNQTPADSSGHSVSAPAPPAAPAPASRPGIVAVSDVSQGSDGAPRENSKSRQAKASSYSSGSHDSQPQEEEPAGSSNRQDVESAGDTENKSAPLDKGGNIPFSETNPVKLEDVKSTDVHLTDDVQGFSTTSKNTESVTENTEITVLAHVPPMFFLFFFVMTYICVL